MKACGHSLRFTQLLALSLAPLMVACGSTVVADDGDTSDGGSGGAAATAGSGSTPSSSGGQTVTTGQDGCSAGWQVCDPYPPICDENGNVTGCDTGCSGDPPRCEPGSIPACVFGDWECEEASCPDVLPSVGDPCDVEGLVCVYEELGCDDTEVFDLACQDGAWVAAPSRRCEPIPCREWTAPGDCAAEGCRWLEPGCDGNPLPVAGCFEEFDCDPDSCWSSDEVCTTVSIDPCWDSDCEACAADATVCVPQPVGG